ncbi:MAG: ATP-binding protein, partial [Gemmatimonadaceae bacterium]
VKLKFTLQRALPFTVGAAILAGIIPAGIVLDQQLTSTLTARARADLSLAPAIFSDRQKMSADGMMMRAKEFAHLTSLATALTQNDRGTVKRIAEDARAALGGTPVVIGPDEVAWAGPTSPSVVRTLVPLTRTGKMPVATVDDAGSLHDVALAPVESEGKWIGAAGLAILMDADQAAVLAGLTRANVLVISSTRTVAASTLDSTLSAVALNALLALPDSASRTDSTAKVYDVGVGNRRLIAAVAHIHDAGEVIFVRDLDVELAVLPRLRKLALISAIAALLFALMVGTVLAARLARPVRQLALASDAIARGEFDGALPSADDIGVREVSRMAAAFSAMREALAARLEELNDTNVKLADRTARLTQLQADLVLRERLAATGRLVAQLAHEIRNPVASLRNCLELIRRRVAHDPEALTFANLAIDELMRMHSLAEQMLELDRPRDTAVGSCMPVEVARDVCQLLTVGAGDSDARIEIRIGKSVAGNEQATIARDALKQVLLNLVQNAREAIASAAKHSINAGSYSDDVVTIEIDAHDNQISVSVIDTGPGIDEAHLASVFEPFFTTKSALHGVGLGLFVAEGLIRSAGGRLSVANSIGKSGAMFRAELPMIHVSVST